MSELLALPVLFVVFAGGMVLGMVIAAFTL